MTFLLNSQAQGVSGKNEQSTQTPWRGAQCSCVGLRPALLLRTQGRRNVIMKANISRIRYWSVWQNLYQRGA